MPSRGEQSGSTPPIDAHDPAALVGLEIGDFVVIREIGRGGMGTVFQARQKSLNRIVALKVLSSTLGLTPTAVLRFQREAEAAAKLHHKNIVPIHAQGESNGVHYYAMELIRGESLHDLICRSRAAPGDSSTVTLLADTEPLPRQDDPEATAPMPVTSATTSRDSAGVSASEPTLSQGAPATARQFEKIASVISAVAGALDYAHEQGVIHRDVKPHNLMLGGDQRVHISDFGLARVLEQPGVTTTGECVGSPLYMSPEQIVGGQRKVDKRTDIYSLGATLYEWLTLSPPYPGDTREQVISKVITSEAPPARSLNPHVPMDLETICLKALEKDPDRRYQSAGEMRDDLRRFLAHETIRAKRAGVMSRAGKLVQRNKVTSVVAAALVVALGLTFALVHQARKSSGREQERQQEIAAISETTEELAQETAELQEVVRAREEEAAEVGTRNEMARAMLQGENFGEQVKEIPGATELLAVLAGGLEPDPLAERMSAEFIDQLRAREARRLEARLGPGEGAAHYLYLQALASEDPEPVASLVNECLRLDPGHVGAKMLAAALACAEQDYDRMSAHAAAVVQEQPDEPDGHLLRGTAQLLSGELEASITDFNMALQLGKGISWALALRGVAYQRRKDYAQAMRDFNEALAEFPDNVVALLERGRTHAYLKDYEAAIADATRVVELEGENVQVEVYVFRGDCYDALERYRESSEDYTRAIKLDTVSPRIGTKLWQAIAKREKQEADKADAAAAKKLDAPAEPEEAPATSDSTPDSETEGDKLEWLKRLLKRKDQDPQDQGGVNLQFRYPLRI